MVQAMGLFRLWAMELGRGILGMEDAWNGRPLMVACPNIGEFKRPLRSAHMAFDDADLKGLGELLSFLGFILFFIFEKVWYVII